ncbi:hypothetical protein ES332_D11G315400v1 [Gossypium tomentosum]|uniref:Uncharacterized protein n=1 Tax=Gossypium tomentosum TaxID=34277 RepID=A0A5D2IUR6_GOSTO|nr:hypothetical protein ES332_D11G315400v1 [Gossypium tomentosum]
MSLDNVKRPLRPTNSRLGLNGSGSEKHEKRTRNKDRPDHGVWSPLHCSDVRKASEELLTPSVLQSAQASRNPNEGINASAQKYLVLGSIYRFGI